MLLASLQFSLNVTFPTILMLLLGIFLRQRQWLDDHFCQVASKLVFNIALPALLFINIVQHPVDYSSQIRLVAGGFLSTLLIYGLSEWLAARYITARRYRGIFVQGIFRGNTGILGLALCLNAYGVAATAPASVYTACITLLFNVLAVITLTHSLCQGQLSAKKIGLSLAKNPLIIAILLGILWSKLALPTPEAMMRSGHYLANIALPIALICAGASLNFNQLRQFRHTDPQQRAINHLVWASCVGRLLIAPLITVLIGRFVLQLDPMSVGMLFLMSSTPVAAASYPMVQSLGGDATATANLLALSVLGYMFTSSLGLFVLRQLQWI